MFQKKLLLSLAFVILSTLFITHSTNAATHTKKTGEQLADIAARYNTTVEILLELNGMESKEEAVTGVKLQLPAHVTEEQQAEMLENYEVVKTFKVQASAFTAQCSGCLGKTAYGIDLKKNPDVKLIAVDPKVIPLGTKVWVEGYGIAIAGDTGGSIKGNKIDIFMKTKKQAYNWGRKNVVIKILK
jgi:3D (Asp-Asp-Asp) domain-containing protein